QAVDSDDVAKETLEKVDEPSDIRNVTEALEDGRYAAKCVRARVDGRPLPVRRPPCFFNPQHGPSVEDIDWAPVGGMGGGWDGAYGGDMGGGDMGDAGGDGGGLFGGDGGDGGGLFGGDGGGFDIGDIF